MASSRSAEKSSLTMVPWPGPSRRAFVPPERLTVNVSSISTAVSPLTVTSMVLEVWPGEKVSVPLVEM
jgi:hypothetical protein